MSILFEAELSLAVRVMAINEFFGRLSDLMSSITHCPLVAAAVACAADLRHSLTAFGNSLPDGLDKTGNGCLSHAVLVLMMYSS
jgi:hypothetical protein